jgi:hypothetical protein
MTSPLAYRVQIETLLGVVRNPVTKLVTNYGVIGKYTFSNGYQNTAFTVGTVPLNISKVEGLEFILSYPDLTKSHRVGGRSYGEGLYRLNIVLRSGGLDTKAMNAVLVMQRSEMFTGFNYSFQDANPKIGSFPQFYCTFKEFVFREQININ